VAGTFSHFLGSDPRRWRTGVPGYRAIVYRDAWPGVDVRFYEGAEGLEYDVVVRPGSDLAQARFVLEGALETRLTAGGGLESRLGRTAVVQRPPVAHQRVEGETHPVRASFRLTPGPPGQQGSDRAGYTILAAATLRPEATLVADPVLVFSTLLGGWGNEFLQAVATDAAGQVYLAGATLSANFPAGPEGFGPHGQGGLDGFVVRLDPEGTGLVWGAYLGGPGEDRVTGLAVDGDGAVLVGGFNRGGGFPTVDALHPDPPGGESDGFVAKIDPSGARLVWSTYLGGSDADRVECLGVDAEGAVYAAGTAWSRDLPATAGALFPAARGLDDGFAAKFDAAGHTLVYATYLGGRRSDQVTGLAVGADGSLYLTGSTDSVDFPLVNPMSPLPWGDADAFVARLDPAGAALVYSGLLGGTGPDAGQGIAVNSLGDAALTGTTYSPDFGTRRPLLPCRADPVRGTTDAFVASLDAAGDLVYATCLGGSDTDLGAAVDLDETGRVVVAGTTASPDFPWNVPLDALSRPDSPDAFVTVFDPSGEHLVISSRFGGGDFDAGLAMTLDSLGRIVLAGDSLSLDLPLVHPLWPLTDFLHSGLDAFVAIIDPRPLDHRIDAAARGPGRISPEGTVPVPEGGEPTFRLFPDAGCRVREVRVDGAYAGQTTAYTFPPVRVDHAITASFARDLVRNGSFEGGRPWPSPWRGAHLAAGDGAVPAPGPDPPFDAGSRVFRLTGSSRAASLRQVLALSGGPGETFILRGWSRGGGRVAGRGSGALGARIGYADGSARTLLRAFPPGRSGWREGTLGFTTERSYRSLTVFLMVPPGAGSRLFDDVNLVRW
jgi:hypothetical protein